MLCESLFCSSMPALKQGSKNIISGVIIYIFNVFIIKSIISFEHLYQPPCWTFFLYFLLIIFRIWMRKKVDSNYYLRMAIGLYRERRIHSCLDFNRIALMCLDFFNNYILLIMLLQLSWFFPLGPPPPSTPYSLRQSPHHCSCLGVMHISSLATPFSILYFISPWLFCNYLFVPLNCLKKEWGGKELPQSGIV